MKRLPVLAALTLGSALAAAPQLPATPGANSSAFFVRDGRPDLAWAICDGVDAPQVIVLGQPDARGRSEVAVFSKTAPGAYSYQAYLIGPGDPGAGQVYYSLTPRTGKADPSGNVHAVNPGVLADPQRAFTPTVASVTLSGAQAVSCRWLPGLRVLGFSARRSFAVTQDAQGRLTYQSYDFAASGSGKARSLGGFGQTTAASVTVAGGRAVLSGGAETFSFPAPNGYSYTVRVDDRGQGSLSVSRAGKVIQSERLNGYVHAVPK